MVFGSQPANAAAECGQRVRSNASRISMISLSHFVNGSSGGHSIRVEPSSEPAGGAAVVDTDVEISCPLTGKCRVRQPGLSCPPYREYPLSVVTRATTPSVHRQRRDTPLSTAVGPT